MIRILGPLLLIFTFLFCTTARASGGSIIVTPSQGYSAVDVFTERAPEAFGGFGNDLAMFEKGKGEYQGLQVVNPRSGATLMSLGMPSDYFGRYTDETGFCGVWSSFVTADPDGSSLWVGFTNYGNTDDRIYKVTLDGHWTEKTKLTGNFDMEFDGTTAYVSANTSGLNHADNSLWRFDTTTGQTRAFAFVGGYSAGLGVDSAGDVYYGNYGFSPGNQYIYRFSAQQISDTLASESDPLLQLKDAEILTRLDASGPYDLDVDAADNVVFNLNTLAGDQSNPTSASSEIAVWNGTVGSGMNYDVIGDGGGQSRWYTMLATTGDIRQPGGTVYVNDYFSPGIAELTATPEPSTFVLLSIAGITVAAYAYRRRAFRTKQQMQEARDVQQ
jgi:hypothetical protein